MVTTDIDVVLERFPNATRDALIPILQEVQQQHGYLSRDAVVRIGRHLRLPASKIYGVATFYNQFRFQPQGRNHVQVCRGTACHVKGSLAILEAIKRSLKIEPGQTSRDGEFSLEGRGMHRSLRPGPRNLCQRRISCRGHNEDGRQD